MTLTRSEIAAVYRACEALCYRIKRDPHWFDWIDMDTFRAIDKFYGFNIWSHFSSVLKIRKNERIMALLLFVEVNK